MFAQSVGEYSARSGGGTSSGVQQLLQTFQDWIGNTTPTTWMTIGAIVLALWFFNRRPTRY